MYAFRLCISRPEVPSLRRRLVRSWILSTGAGCIGSLRRPRKLLSGGRSPL